MTYIGDKGYLLEVAKGNVPGNKIVHVYGEGSFQLASVPRDIWRSTGDMTWRTAVATVALISDSTDDDGDPTSSTGAHTVTIEGLDSSFVEISEVMTLNGTSEVTSSASFLRINRAYVSAVGVYHAANTGSITGKLGSPLQFTIAATRGVAQISRYTVPAGKTAYLLNIFCSAANTKQAIVRGHSYNAADDVATSFAGGNLVWWETTWMSAANWYGPHNGAISFAAKTDIWFRVEAVAADATGVSIVYDLLVSDN